MQRAWHASLRERKGIAVKLFNCILVAVMIVTLVCPSVGTLGPAPYAFGITDGAVVEGVPTLAAQRSDDVLAEAQDDGAVLNPDDILGSVDDDAAGDPGPDAGSDADAGQDAGGQPGDLAAGGADDGEAAGAAGAEGAEPAAQGPSLRALTEDELASHRVAGLDPERTTVNLFNYDTGVRSPSGSDTLGTTGAASPQVNYDTWLGYNGGGNINYGRLLTFGDGMRHMGYWNQGIVAGYGEIARERPGMQNIVARRLSASGYPTINDAAASSDIATGYDGNPELYSHATRTVGSCTEAVYYNAGPLFWQGYNGDIAAQPGGMAFYPVDAKNIDDAVQARAAGAGAGSAGDLAPEQLSLSYLFDPAQDNPGKEQHSDVTGLFQMDDQGYYYYNARKNFAEFSPDGGNHFNLYDAPAGLRTDGTDSYGNFFPFNAADTAFTLEDGALKSAINAANAGNPQGVFVDHHLGLTVESEFRQPVGGKVGAGDMTFEFVGDEDVWVFIDDVLVLDMGGIHSEIYGTINFATGEVCVGTAYNANGEIFDEAGGYITPPAIRTSLREQFESAGAAGAVRWNGETFASSTSHTLKLFYLERGNYDSSLALRFNLQPELYQQIKKVDQDGEPLAGAEFDLYAADVPAGTTAESAKGLTLADVSLRPGALAHLTTDDEGEAWFTEQGRTARGDPFNFADRYDGASEGLIYILRETKAPPGYKAVPSDLLLRFDPANTMLIVNNRYQTGANAGFNSYITGNTGQIFYGRIGPDGGAVERFPEDELPAGLTAHVPVESQRDGLVVAVPMLKQPDAGTGQRWYPLWGDAMAGFNAYKGATGDDLNATMRAGSLAAALLQAAEAYRSESGWDERRTEGWHLTWDAKTSRLGGTLSNLPGRAERYLLNDPDGDMRMFYGVIEPEALAKATGLSASALAAMTSDERYAALGQAASDALAADGGEPGARFDALMAAIDPYPPSFTGRGYNPLDISEFIRNFRSVIFIPNEQRQLRVLKIDQNGQARNGAEFSLFADRASAEASTGAVAVGQTAQVDGRDGMLIFEPRQSHSADAPGYADVVWPDVGYEGAAAALYLKETRAPAGCEINDAIVCVQVGVISIYADAGAPDDGVSVAAGVGKLTQTMVKFASDGDVNVTLRDITSFEQRQPSGGFALDGWEDELIAGGDGLYVPSSMDLRYQDNAVVDYGLSDADGGDVLEPFFVTDTGYIRTRVQQHLRTPPGAAGAGAIADDLGDTDITGLFTLMNTVIVSDHDGQAPAAGALSVSKRVEGAGIDAADIAREYRFCIELADERGEPLGPDARFPFYGADRVGQVANGDVLPLRHGEEIRVLGLPPGTRFRVSELDAGSWGLHAVPASGAIDGAIAGGETASAAFVNTTDAPSSPAPGEPDGPPAPGEPGAGLPQTGDGARPVLMPALGDGLRAAFLRLAALAAAAALIAWAALMRPACASRAGAHGRASSAADRGARLARAAKRRTSSAAAALTARCEGLARQAGAGDEERSSRARRG